MPLLAELIAAQQPTIDEIMLRRAEDWIRHEIADRARRARMWREGRLRLAGMGDNLRPLVLSYWNNHRWLPGDPLYLVDMLHSIETGKLVPDDHWGFRFAASPSFAEHMAQIAAFRDRPLKPLSPVPLSG